MTDPQNATWCDSGIAGGCREQTRLSLRTAAPRDGAREPSLRAHNAIGFGGRTRLDVRDFVLITSTINSCALTRASVQLRP
jgi:hypothetical protein